MAYNLNVELWTEYGIGMVIFAVRFYARWKTIGIRNFSWDDYLTATSAIFWTLETTFLYTCALYGNNITLTPETAELVPDSMVPQLQKGSQLAFAAWVFYILLVWSLKGVVIFLYSRITTGLWQHRLVKFVSAFCILAFLASILLHFGECVPIQKSWQIKPFPGDNCTKRTLNYIVIEVLNILTDASIIIIPLPVILSAQMPLYRKIVLGCLFSSGVFVIICAILRSYYSVKNIKDLSVALGWASREIFVSAIAVSSPGIKPLFNKTRWFSSKKTSDKQYGTQGGRSTYPWSSAHKSGKDEGTLTSIVGVEDEERQLELSSAHGWPRRKARGGTLRDSQEHIIDLGGNGDDQTNQIQVTTEYHIQESIIDPSPIGTPRQDMIG